GKMMRASATAAIALKRLRSDSDQGRHHTFTYVREGTPDSKKLKTNGDGVAGEAGGGAADAQAAA
ncbi:MAG: hypothetical protein KJS68_08445, partial [Alphaproteobacteria bacterium]|nr:hypothetical protein [Alphaproteobacteria bacterium]